MALIINTNVASLGAQRSLNRAQAALQRSFERLSSGLRINSASDDAAGLAIAEKMDSRIRALQQAQRNTSNGVSLVQTAEGSYGEISSMLARMNELGVQAADGALTDSDRAALQGEFTALRSEIDRISGSTEFNSQKLLDGTLAAGLDLQVGGNNTANDRITVTIPATNSTTLGLAGLDISTQAGAQAAIGTIGSATDTVVGRRAELGAFQNRLATAGRSIGSQVLELRSATSRIRDADIAEESAAFARNHIAFRGATAMLAQANFLPAQALSLLRR